MVFLCIYVKLHPVIVYYLTMIEILVFKLYLEPPQLLVSSQLLVNHSEISSKITIKNEFPEDEF